MNDSDKEENHQKDEENNGQPENSNIENPYRQDEQNEFQENRNENENEQEPGNSFPEVFIKNIPFSTSNEDLHNFLSKFVKVYKVEIVQNNGYSKGYGYVKLEDKKEKQKILSLPNDDLILEGRKLEILEPIRRQKINKEIGKTLFVKNIPYTANEEDIINFFSDCKNIKVRIFYENGRSRGFAHIDFENEEDVEKALKKNNEKMNDRIIKVERIMQNNFERRVYGRQMRERPFRTQFRGGRMWINERREYVYRDRDIGDRNRERRHDWEGERERERGIRENEWDRNRDREWRRDSRERNLVNHRYDGREWERRERDKYRESEREREKEREREREKEGEKDRYVRYRRSRDRRDDSRDRRDDSRDIRINSRDRKENSRDRFKNKSRDRSRDYDRERRYSHYHGY